MRKKTLFALILAVAWVTLACGITINVPVDRIVTGEKQTESIAVPLPQESQVTLSLSFGAGELTLNPGATQNLVEGSATYNVADFKPRITSQPGKVSLESGKLEISGIPKMEDEVMNIWDLKLADIPMNLVIMAGAYHGRFELGGLSLYSLEITDGAADVQLSFSTPNQVAMDTLRYTTGASTVRLSGLLNANFASMIFRGGAGDYTLDFSGSIQRDAVVVIESGMSHVVIIVPPDVSAKVVITGGLTQVTSLGEWEKRAEGYFLDGSGAQLLITVDMGAGSLELRNS